MITRPKLFFLIRLSIFEQMRAKVPLLCDLNINIILLNLVNVKSNFVSLFKVTIEESLYSENGYCKEEGVKIFIVDPS